MTSEIGLFKSNDAEIRDKLRLIGVKEHFSDVPAFLLNLHSSEVTFNELFCKNFQV